MTMTMRLLAPAIAALMLMPAAAGAQEPGNEKINQLIVYGDQPCPADSVDEIVICRRVPDPYRIPAPLRGDPENPQNQAWGARSEQLEYAGRTGIASCSPSGSGGASGCFAQLVRAARAERAGDLNWVSLVEEKRQERLGKIDAASDAIEADVKAREEAAKAAKKPE